jgi:hypothetical protein
MRISPHNDGRWRTDHRDAMGDACELRCSAYDAPIWTWFFPMASQRWDATVLLTFGGGVSWWRAGNGNAVLTKLCIGEQHLSAPLATGRAPTRVVNSGEALGAVGSASVTVYWRGGDGRWKVGLGWGKLIMEVAGAAIYMGFGPLSCTTRSRSRIYLQ